jgi:hypothetical protein
MASLDSIKMRHFLAEGIVRQQGADTPMALRLFYVGDGAAESVTVVTATSIALKEVGEDAVTYAFATQDTVGKLADAINGGGVFRAVVVDALSSDPTASQFVNGAITAGNDEDGNPVWDVRVDTSEAAIAAVNLTPRGLNKDPRPAGHRVHLQEIFYRITLGAAAADRVRIIKRRGGHETVIFRATSVSNTDTTINFAAGAGKITAGPDEELIARIHDGTSMADGTFVAFRVVGVRE